MIRAPCGRSSRRSRSLAIFGPTPGSVAAGANKGSSKAGRMGDLYAGRGGAPVCGAVLEKPWMTRFGALRAASECNNAFVFNGADSGSQITAKFSPHFLFGRFG